MGRGVITVAERAFLGIADIAVALALHPGPAGGGIEHQHVVAMEELGVDAGVGLRRLANVRHRDGDAGRATGGEALGSHLTFETGVGEIRAESVQAGVAGGQIVHSFKW